MQAQDPWNTFGPDVSVEREFARDIARDARRAARGARHRVRRGDVQAAILTLLGDGEMHGYQVITELARRSGGRWRPGAGSIYPTLRNLEENGLIIGRDEDGKRVFRLTETGAKAAAGADGTPWQEFEEDSPSARLRSATQNLVSALGQLEAVGTPEQILRAVETLKSARKAIYLALAEDES
jgi:DNA-binding PadR family transcriptional regulator